MHWLHIAFGQDKDRKDKCVQSGLFGIPAKWGQPRYAPSHVLAPSCMWAGHDKEEYEKSVPSGTTTAACSFLKQLGAAGAVIQTVLKVLTLTAYIWFMFHACLTSQSDCSGMCVHSIAVLLT